MAKSILGRKRDLAYLVYFALHIPIMFIVDLYPLYPPHLLPSFMINLRTWYISTYDDRFFVDPPPFFTLYAWLELFYHVPVSGWCVWGLVSDHPKIPLVLLPYATQTFITTLTCMFDYSNWETDLSHKVGLTSLYGPYLALSLFMLVDMYTRLDSVISKSFSSGKIGQKGLWEGDGDREGKKEL